MKASDAKPGMIVELIDGYYAKHTPWVREHVPGYGVGRIENHSSHNPEFLWIEWSDTDKGYIDAKWVQPATEQRLFLATLRSGRTYKNKQQQIA